VTTADVLKCEIREKKTKGYLNQMLKQEWVPGIVYGQEQDPVPIFLKRRDFYKNISSHGARGLFTLQIEGESSPTMALVRDMQKHPISGHVIHLDFLTVNMSENISNNVGIYLEGEDELIKKGLILQNGVKEVGVTCMPKDLPEVFVYNVANLDIGDKVTIRDLAVPDGVEITTELDAVVAAVLAPSRAAGEQEEEETANEGQKETQE